MDNEKIFKNELKKADIESINLWHHMKIRSATINDLDAIAAVEAECFPAAEAATKEEFAERIKFYGDHFWLMFDTDKLISFVDGFVTDQPDLTDEMYENASMHNEKGAWQMIFGVNTIPSYRQHGYAGELIRKAIQIPWPKRTGINLQRQADPLLCLLWFRRRRHFRICPRKCGMASDAINVLIHLNVLFSIRQKQDFSHSVIPFPPTSQIRIFYHYTIKTGPVNDLNERLVIVPVFLYNKSCVMTDQIEIL